MTGIPKFICLIKELKPMTIFSQVIKLLCLAGVVGLSACGGGGGYAQNTKQTSSLSSASSISSVSSSLSSASSSSEPADLTLIDPIYPLADFPIGVAVPSNALNSAERTGIVEHYFGEITAENIMKPSYLHPSEGSFSFSNADAMVNWAIAMGKNVHGHTLIWHDQIPSWIKTYNGAPAQWETMMTDHVSEIVGHFRGSVVSWDVVNEALSDGGGYRTDSPWYVGFKDASYIEKAFIAARAADPDALLYYNDYNLSFWGAKFKEGLLPMIENLQSKDVPIDGIGFQMHVDLSYPTLEQMKSAWADVVNKRLNVKLTELDVKAVYGGNMAPDSLSSSLEAAQAERYKAIVKAYLEVVPVGQRGGITVWGITDQDSWRDEYYPLLFNDDFSHKDALPAVIEALTQ